MQCLWQFSVRLASDSMRVAQRRNAIVKFEIGWLYDEVMIAGRVERCLTIRHRGRRCDEVMEIGRSPSIDRQVDQKTEFELDSLFNWLAAKGGRGEMRSGGHAVWGHNKTSPIAAACATHCSGASVDAGSPIVQPSYRKTNAETLRRAVAFWPSRLRRAISRRRW